MLNKCAQFIIEILSHLCYLTNGRQYTVLQDYESELEYVTYGVPQGSVLGPLLFFIYVNDIQYAITNAKIKLFADDTKVV